MVEKRQSFYLPKPDRNRKLFQFYNMQYCNCTKDNVRWDILRPSHTHLTPATINIDSYWWYDLHEAKLQRKTENCILGLIEPVYLRLADHIESCFFKLSTLNKVAIASIIITCITVLVLRKLKKKTQPHRTAFEYFATFKNVAHSLKLGETPKTSASHQASNYVQRS